MLTPAFQQISQRIATMASAAPEVISAAVPLTLLDTFAKSPNAVGAAWIISSSLFTTYSTTKFLKYHSEHTVDEKHLITLPRPALLTFYRFSGSLILGLLLHPNLHIMKRLYDTLNSIHDFALPAAFLFIANYANSIALSRIGISLTYTSKCGIPIFTVLLTLILDGARALPSIPTLLTLIPIAGGIAAASWESPTFEGIGFLFAMISTLSQTALNVTSKKAMARTGLTGDQAQRCMVAVGLIITLISMIVHHTRLDTPEEKEHPPTWLSAMACTAYHVEYVLSFMFVKLVAPITYGACDAVRRLSIICSGHYMFGHDRFTKTNLIGIATALLGALGYAIASHAP